MIATTRRAFARAMSSVREGMSAPDVKALLGEPDDIRTPHDSLGGVTTYRTKAVWCYGTSGHLTTPTLGAVYLDEEDRVQFAVGGGEALSEAILDEGELRCLLRVLDRVSSYSAGEAFDPLGLIQAVNALQPLGKERALATIAEYLRVGVPYARSSGREGMFLVLRLLFDVSAGAGSQPAMHVGLPRGPQPGSPADAPHYPLVGCEDIPLLAVNGYTLFGCPQNPAEHLNYFRKHGQVRERPLTPTDRPFACLEAAEGRWPWLFADDVGPDCRRLLAMQVLNLVGSVYRPVRNDMGYPDSYRDWPWNSPRYPPDIAAIARLSVRWDAARCLYTLPDGTFLPEDETVNYRVEFWEFSSSGLRVKVSVTRQTDRYVSVEFRLDADGPGFVPQYRFEVYDVRSASRPACEVTLGGTVATSGSWGSSTSGGVVLPLGGELRVRVVVGSETRSSPVIRPRPYHPVAFSPSWRTEAVVTLARQMYDRNDFSAMPTLADALRDAGCDSADILHHCRDAAVTHVRGCWVVDLVLGAEPDAPPDVGRVNG